MRDRESGIFVTGPIFNDGAGSAAAILHPARSRMKIQIEVQMNNQYVQTLL